MKAGTTIRVRGEGGAEWDQDVPELGTVQRELLDDGIAKGRIQVLVDPDADVVELAPAPVGASQVAQQLTSAVDNFGRLDEDAQIDVLDLLDATRPDLVDVGGALADVGRSEPAGATRPNVRAGKDEWVAYAVAQGADPGEAGAMTKEALIERYGKET
jgi:hypothetical protein